MLYVHRNLSKPGAMRSGNSNHRKNLTRSTIPILMREGLEIITLHVFATIWWQRGVERLSTACILVGTLWLFLVVFIAASASVHKTPPFYYPTPVWHSPR